MKATRTAALVLLAALVGCDESADDIAAKSTAPTTKTRRRTAAPPGVKAPAKTQSAAARREKATGGVGKKGRDYKILTSIGVYFRTKQKLTFDHIQYAVKLYKAEHGRIPKSWDEFKKEILDRNMFKLPELPEGDKYVFEQGQLMVEHPQK